ncbi:hypothetical protein SAY87_004321 [Trapa incisa]|uniref:Nucleotide-diphospho-sugar transferase domain-containing protein n=1 Tax=Trapa incisa TaxID=236973 RepID=A0AAN7JNS1_9MYRT|nr:hypothetical protein SAY87_004321 [Trapa incisa]
MADSSRKLADDGGIQNRDGAGVIESNRQSSCSTWSGRGLPYLTRDVKLGLLFVGLAISCLLLYSSTNPLKFFPMSYPSYSDRKLYGLERVLRSAAMEDNRTVILTTLNDAWAEPGSIFDVFLESFRVGNGTRELLDHVVVVALDKKAFHRCLQVHPHCFALTSNGNDFSGEADFMSHDYLDMMWRRIDFLGVVLEKGFDFVFTDTDIVWLRSPFPHFYPDADFQIACDFYNYEAADKRNRPNGGFTYVRSNQRTVKFYKYWYQSRKSYPGNHDQDVLNQIKSHKYLEDIGLQMRFLDTAYMGGFCQLSKDLGLICTVHANCCIGLDNKIRDLLTVLDDWKMYLAGNRTGDWTVPRDCVGSFDRPHKPHKHGLQRLV